MQVSTWRCQRRVDVGVRVHPDDADLWCSGQRVGRAVHAADRYWVITAKNDWYVAAADSIAYRFGYL